MSKHVSYLYEFILEASERGELWGLSLERSHWTQLEIDYNSCINS